MLYSHDRHPAYGRLAGRPGEEGRAGVLQGPPIGELQGPRGTVFWLQGVLDVAQGGRGASFTITVKKKKCTVVPAITLQGRERRGPPSHHITSHHITSPSPFPFPCEAPPLHHHPSSELRRQCCRPKLPVISRYPPVTPCPCIIIISFASWGFPLDEGICGGLFAWREHPSRSSWRTCRGRFARLMSGKRCIQIRSSVALLREAL